MSAKSKGPSPCSDDGPLITGTFSAPVTSSECTSTLQPNNRGAIANARIVNDAHNGPSRRGRHLLASLGLAAGGCWFHRWTRPSTLLGTNSSEVEQFETGAAYSNGTPPAGEQQIRKLFVRRLSAGQCYAVVRLSNDSSSSGWAARTRASSRESSPSCTQRASDSSNVNDPSLRVIVISWFRCCS